MPGRRSLHDEIEKLKAEIAALKPAPAEADASAPGEDQSLAGQMGELTGLVQDMLNEAEETMTRHPVATVAGALALGIVIGRLTAR
jgi:ElaB/YqjD/DUF883 family membrane-anchored ribosome-binding protein